MKYLLVVFTAFCVFVSTAANIAGMTPAKVSGDVVVGKDWFVYGPFNHGESPAVPLLKGGKLPPVLKIGSISRRLIKVSNVGGHLDLKKLFGKLSGKGAYVCIPLFSEKGGEGIIGLAADWYFNAYLNGKMVYSTGDEGNMLSPPQACHHLIKAVFPKGKSMLIIGVSAGTGGFSLYAAGSQTLRNWHVSQWRQAIPPPDMTGIERIPEFKEKSEWRMKDLSASIDHASGTVKLTAGSKPGVCYVPLSLDPGKQYKFVVNTILTSAAKGCFVSIREKLSGGDIYVLKKLDLLRQVPLYCYLENPQPYLMIHCPARSSVTLRKLSLRRSLDPGRSYRDWRVDRTPEEPGLRTLSREYSVKGFRWDKDSSEKPLKIMMMTPFWYQLHALELEQRFNIRCETVPFHAAYMLPAEYWSMTDGQPVRVNPMRELMKKQWNSNDCIVLDMLNALPFNAKLTGRILEFVSNGGGLVISGWDSPYYPRKDGNDPETALNKFKQGAWSKALNRNNRTDAPEKFIRISAVSGPEYEFYKYGKGRVVYLRRGGDREYKRQHQLEKRFALLGKAVYWASGKMQESFIEKAVTSKDIVTVSVAGNAAGCRMKMSITDEHYIKLAAPVEKPLKDGRVSFTLPADIAGKVYIQLSLVKGKKLLDWDIIQPVIRRENTLKKISEDNCWMPVQSGSKLKGTVHLRRSLKAGEDIEISLTDTQGRIWHRERLTGSGMELPFVIDPAVMPVISGRVTAVHAVNNRALSSVYRELILKKPGFSPEAGFFFGLMGTQQNSIPYLARMKELFGLDFIATANTAEGVVQGTDNNIQCYTNGGFGANLFGRDNTAVGSADAPARKLCLSGKVRRNAEYWIKRHTARGIKYGSCCYVLDHEVDLLGYIRRAAAKTDFCFSPECLAHLRRFLEKEYGSLEALNRSWQQNFKSWQEVVPETLSQVKKSGVFPRWIDHRRNMDKVFTDFTEHRMKLIRRLDPSAEGFDMNVRSGPNTNDSFSGIDYEQLFQLIGGSSLPEYYQKYLQPEFRKSRIDWQNGAMWGPFSYSGNRRLTAERMSRQLWSGLFWQRWGYVLYTWIFRPYQPFICNDSFLVRPDLSVTPMGKLLKRELEQIRSGVDTLIFDSKMDHSGIAMFYSRSSEHAATLWQSLLADNKLAQHLDPRRSQFSFWEPGITANGRSLCSVSSTQIRQGVLRNGKIKMLILPFCQNLDVKDAAEIREFVRSGGVLLADIRPAIADIHGRSGKTGLLDDVFGIRQDTRSASYIPRDIEISVPGFSGRGVAGGNPVLTTAKAQGSGEVPLYIVNSFGKGRTLLLNFYKEGQGIYPVFRKILEDFNIPELFSCKVSDAVWNTGRGNAKTGDWKNDDLSGTASFNIDSEDDGDVESMMFTGVPDFDRLCRLNNGNITIFAYGCGRNANIGDGKRKLEFTLPFKGHVYDLRRGGYLGYKQRFIAESALESMEFFAVTREKIEKPVIRTSVSSTPQGCRIKVTASSRPATEKDSRFVMRFSITAPDGSRWDDLSVNRICRNGAAEHTFVLPVNAPAGKWRISVREAISGLECSEHINITR